MNLPNKLTILRVILIPFFVVFMLFDITGAADKWIALVIFCVASLTDMLDGKIARKYNNDIQSVHRCQTDQRGTYQQLVCKRIHKFAEVRYQVVLSGDFPIQHICQAGNTEDHKCDPLICCSGNIK